MCVKGSTSQLLNCLLPPMHTWPLQTVTGSLGSGRPVLYLDSLKTVMIVNYHTRNSGQFLKFKEEEEDGDEQIEKI